MIPPKKWTNIHLSPCDFWGRWTVASLGSWHQNRLQRGISIVPDRFVVDLSNFVVQRVKSGAFVSRWWRVVFKWNEFGEKVKGEHDVPDSWACCCSWFFLGTEECCILNIGILWYSLVEPSKSWLPFPGGWIRLSLDLFCSEGVVLWTWRKWFQQDSGQLP